MTNIQEIKQKVARLIEEKGLSQNSVSLQMGYERTYLTQFINRENPKRLSDKARRRLATILEVPEQELTDEDLSDTIEPLFIAGANQAIETATNFFRSLKSTAKIDIINVSACCGNGQETFSEKTCGHVSIPLEELKSITNISPNNIKLIKATGDSMDPTIKDGDMVWIDTGNNFISSDGIYLLRMPTGLAIKRIQTELTGAIAIKSDNDKYSNTTANVGEINVIGKVIYIWNGKKV